MNEFFKDMPNKVLLIPTIVGAALVLSTVIAAGVFYQVRSADDLLTVTGSMKASVTADQAKWVTRISRTVSVSNLRSGYEQMAADLKLAKAFYAKEGVTETALTVSPVTMNEMYNYNKTGYEETQYNLSQTVELQSTDIAKVTGMAKDLSSLVGQGVLISTQQLEYYYSKLPDLRVSLLDGAIKDAKARAQAIAGAGGNKVGALRAASSGVVQVLPHNSVEIADYGAYDTSSVEKDVMVTVKASFSVK